MNMSPLAFNPGATTPVIKSISYVVNTTGDALFNSTIASSDSPDYTEAAAEANAQCVAVSPLAVERVV